MLVLSRKIGQSIVITLADGETITITLVDSKSRVKIGIDADPRHQVLRSELLERGHDG